MSLYILLLIVSTIALALILWCGYNEDEPALLWFAIIFSCLALGSLLSIINYDEPTAIDVYRGKTTLEITYRDSVAVDSVVVYKKFDYGK